MKIITLLFLLVIIGLPLHSLINNRSFSLLKNVVMIGVPLSILLVSLYFIVLRIELKNTELIIRRFGKNVSIPLER
ncbi:MAG: hypothetical protein L3J46_07685, partial [Kangiellaceae bacterium]|nr:hypothetical protein [Kangiellaceae bacterium]